MPVGGRGVCRRMSPSLFRLRAAKQPKPRIPPSTLVDLGSRSGFPDGRGSISAPIHSAARSPDRHAENPPHRPFPLHGIASKKGYDAIPGRRRLSPNHCPATPYRSYCIAQDSSFPHSSALTPSLPGPAILPHPREQRRSRKGVRATDANTCRSFVVARESMAPNARDHPPERTNGPSPSSRAQSGPTVRPGSPYFYLSTTVELPSERRHTQEIGDPTRLIVFSAACVFPVPASWGTARGFP